MAVYKNKSNNTWYVSVYFKNWKGESDRKVKRGFKTKREAQEWERTFLQQNVNTGVRAARARRNSRSETEK